MNKFYTFCLLSAFALPAFAQKQAVAPSPIQEYGKINKEDLELKACDFEKDANAEVLFDKGSVYFSSSYDIVLERHTRIKIFNDKAKEEANIRIPYFGGDHSENITAIQAETINLNNDKVETTKVDKKLIYTKTIDKARNEIVFAFPNVQAGSIIEYKYTLTAQSIGDFPDWYFQHDLPVRYSEFDTDIPNMLHYKNLLMVTMPFAQNTSSVMALANVPSLREEPYMNSKKDNAQRILYELSTVDGSFQNFSSTWKDLGEKVLAFDDFGGQFKRKLNGEDVILAKAKALHTDDEKIALILNEVKTAMKWNDDNERYTNDGTSTAWDKKTGNSTEVNLILYHLLQKAGVKVNAMLVSTRDNGKANPAYPSRYQFNKTVVYFKVDSSNYYVLDATNKYNSYKDIPQDLLNSFGFCIDKDNEKYDLVFLQRAQPSRQVVLIDAEIMPDAKVVGTAQLNNDSYNRINAIERYKKDGEKKYIDYLRDGDNNLKIADLKFDNMEVDTVPLTQNISFTLALTSADDNYIYFNPTLFSTLHTNPFLSENRYSDINFGYMHNYQMSGNYKMPAGYKTNALPANVSMSLPDKSITFRRVMAEQDGVIVVSYSISQRKTIYFKEDYDNLHAFYKKMHELLDEQIVLKKS